MISSKELLSRLGIKSGKTLTRWYQRGLIPAPSIATHPSGRGKSAYWPDWVLERCVRIRQLLGQGHSLDELAATLDQDWAAEERKYQRRSYDFAEAMERLDFKDSCINFEELVEHSLRALLGQFQDVEAIWQQIHAAVAKNNATAVLGPLAEGYKLVLVLNGRDAKVLPDFMVSHALASASSEQPFIVIPLSGIAQQAFGQVVKKLPAIATIGPAPQVRIVDKKKFKDVELKLIGDSDFELKT